MAEFSNREVRVNETTAKISQLNQDRAARVVIPAPGPGFRTLPDGRVINRFGHEVYNPRSKDAKTGT